MPERERRRSTSGSCSTRAAGRATRSGSWCSWPDHRLRRHRQSAARHRHSDGHEGVGRRAQRVLARGLPRLPRHDDRRPGRGPRGRPVRAPDGAAVEHGGVRRADDGRRLRRRPGVGWPCFGCWPASASAAPCRMRPRWRPSTCPCAGGPLPSRSRSSACPSAATLAGLLGIRAAARLGWRMLFVVAASCRWPPRSCCARCCRSRRGFSRGTSRAGRNWSA